MPISLKHVYYTYDRGTPAEKEALEDRNLIFRDHCFTALIGRTGSGKSTLIQHLNGLLLPDSGIIDANGYVIDRTLEYKKNGKVDVRKRKKTKKNKPILSLFENGSALFSNSRSIRSSKIP